MKTLENIVRDQRIERLIEGRATKLFDLLGSTAVELYQQFGLEELQTDEAAAISGMLHGDRSITNCPDGTVQHDSPDEIMRSRIVLTPFRDDATPRDRALYGLYRQLQNQYGASLRKHDDD